jgi:hypothetical protein
MGVMVDDTEVRKGSGKSDEGGVILTDTESHQL